MRSASPGGSSNIGPAPVGSVDVASGPVAHREGLVAADHEGVARGVHAWGRTALIAGTVAAGGLLLQSLLLLLDLTGILPSAPDFHETGNGFDQDLATLYVGFFRAPARHRLEHRDPRHRGRVGLHRDDRARPGARPGARELAGRGWRCGRRSSRSGRCSASSPTWSTSASSACGGTPASAPTRRRTSSRPGGRRDAFGTLADYLELAAIVTIAVGLVGIAALLSRPLRILALVLAATLLLATVATLAFWDVVTEVTAILTGVVLGPLLLLGLGRWAPRSPWTGPGCARSPG